MATLLAVIFSTNSMEKAIEPIDNTTLAIFDVDLVLIQPSDPAFQMPNIEKYEAKRFFATLSEEEIMEVLTRISLLPGSTLVDPATPCLIRRLQNRGIPVMALTNTLTASNFEADKIERLRKLGFVFAPFCEEEIVFSNLPAFNKTYPTYRSGVLFSNDVPKGEVLMAFLQALQLCPRKVVFIDDAERNLQSVEKSLKKTDIEFVGVHYTAAASFPSEEISREEFDARWQKLIEN